MCGGRAADARLAAARSATGRLQSGAGAEEHVLLVRLVQPNERGHAGAYHQRRRIRDGNVKAAPHAELQVSRLVGVDIREEQPGAQLDESPEPPALEAAHELGERCHRGHSRPVREARVARVEPEREARCHEVSGAAHHVDEDLLVVEVVREARCGGVRWLPPDGDVGRGLQSKFHAAGTVGRAGLPGARPWRKEQTRGERHAGCKSGTSRRAHCAPALLRRRPRGKRAGRALRRRTP
jgi:hypothetical protein